jgi:hypothetical protein
VSEGQMSDGTGTLQGPHSCSGVLPAAWLKSRGCLLCAILCCFNAVQAERLTAGRWDEPRQTALAEFHQRNELLAQFHRSNEQQFVCAWVHPSAQPSGAQPARQLPRCRQYPAAAVWPLKPTALARQHQGHATPPPTQPLPGGR